MNIELEIMGMTEATFKRFAVQQCAICRKQVIYEKIDYMWFYYDCPSCGHFWEVKWK